MCSEGCGYHEDNTTYVGKIIGKRSPVPTAGDCSEECGIKSGCNFWTYKMSVHTCFFLSNYSRKTEYNDSVSGQKPCEQHSRRGKLLTSSECQPMNILFRSWTSRENMYRKIRYSWHKILILCILNTRLSMCVTLRPAPLDSEKGGLENFGWKLYS